MEASAMQAMVLCIVRRMGLEHWQPVSLPDGTNGPNGLAIDPQSPERL